MLVSNTTVVLPKLFKKTNTGAIQYWLIMVDGNSITTEYGQDGTDSPQFTTDVIKEGKNAGRSNATTVEEQALMEAKAKFDKQKKKGYVESFEAAQRGETDALIEGGVLPMLAHKFSEQGHKISYPAYTQGKLDGGRCVAIKNGDNTTLWTRTRKRINSMPHIIEDINCCFEGMDIILDGELYNHDYRHNFEDIMSLIRPDEPVEYHTRVQYHIYDVIDDSLNFHKRWSLLNAIGIDSRYLKIVDTYLVNDEEELINYFDQFRAQGYEGSMVRNMNAMYVHKRSYDLLKIKEFDDAEFDIVGMEEGRGKLMGHIGAFWCTTPNTKPFVGNNFKVKLKGETDRLRYLFENPDLWQGKSMTVKYQGVTNKDRVPRCPVGVAIRDYE